MTFMSLLSILEEFGENFKVLVSGVIPGEFAFDCLISILTENKALLGMINQIRKLIF